MQRSNSPFIQISKQMSPGAHTCSVGWDQYDSLLQEYYSQFLTHQSLLVRTVAPVYNPWLRRLRKNELKAKAKLGYKVRSFLKQTNKQNLLMPVAQQLKSIKWQEQQRPSGRDCWDPGSWADGRSRELMLTYKTEWVGKTNIALKC